MTINSSWVEILKGEAPDAFTESPPFVGKVAYLDGMPLLMAAGSTRRWDDLVRFNFCSPVKRFFRMGTATVVLAFDDYKHVPVAKSITQANRSKKKAKIEFNERQRLETVMPMDYNERLSNRVYKRRVIDMVVETISEQLGMAPGQALIIDYVDCPVRFCVDAGTRRLGHTYMTGIPPMGECDVKFTRWGREFGDMIAHSVDGDFLPIALIEHEKNVREGGREFRMAVYRMEYNMNKAQARKRDSSGEAKPAAPKKRRTMEYVSIPLLYHVIRSAMGQCRPESSPEHQAQFMRMWSYLVAITGTDFTRGAPHIGPKKVWDMLGSAGVWEGLTQSYDTESMQMDPQRACDTFVASLYKACRSVGLTHATQDKFCKHARGSTIDEVLSALMASGLTSRTKSLLPTASRMVVTIRNCNWLLKYWECNQPVMMPPPVSEQGGDVWDYSAVYPDPVCELYGFKRADARKDAVQWSDV